MSSNRITLLPLVLFISFFWILAGCQQEDVTPDATPIPEEPEIHRFVSAEMLQTVTRQEVLAIASFLPEYQQFSQFIVSGFDVYKMTYLTVYQEDSIEASGLVLIPDAPTGETPMLVGLHGTILDKDRAPSNFGNFENLSGQELFAALDYITVIPDYLGFGESSEIFHPYYDALYTGQASTDMLLATQEMLADSIPYKNDLYITGYSEGGYASVATLKYIEEQEIDFNVKATAAGAGGYDIYTMTENVLSQGIYESPGYLVYVVYAYNITNNWNRPLTDFFQEPYATRIASMAEGNQSIGQINAQLTDQVDSLFTADFLSEIRAQATSDFSNALQANSVNQWAPQSALRLYHEADDEIVPYNNSELTASTMNDLGAPSVEFIGYDAPDANSHASGALPMYEMVVPWFMSLREANE